MLIETPNAFEPFIYASMTISGAVGIQLFVFLYFVAFVEAGIRQPGKLRDRFTPFNCLLFILASKMLIQCTIEISCIRAAQNNQYEMYDIIRAVQIAFLSLWEAAYICYTWLRSRDIIDQTVPRLSKVAKYFVYTHVAMTVMQFIPKLVGLAIPSVIPTLTLVSEYLPIALVMAMLAFDASLLVLFIMYLNSSHGVIPVTQGTLKAHIQSIGKGYPVSRLSTSVSTSLTLTKGSNSLTLTRRGIDPRLKIVAYHGIASIACGFVIVGLMVLWAMIYERYLVLVFVLMYAIFWCLFAMKVALWKQKRASVSGNISHT
ncbi:hypothetical protein HDU81_002185 [Chytriomyces hyalinus]|nr:hypothetical protein HDU81_002185 [Chytriomyces hyalinus]